MVKVQGSWFYDEDGRYIMLRGINLSGSSKVPVSYGAAGVTDQNFYQHRQVSFVGRPFPLTEAREHFTRLRAWGFNLLRLLVSWEAVEHAGPGIYDEAYLDYIQAVCRMAGEYGFLLVIDPHQDVWSRFSGGDGAPGWTLEAAGFDLESLEDSGAATLHKTYSDSSPAMIWPTNGSKLAAATMFTLFFGGNRFAPLTLIDGEPAQEFLQHHYLESVRQVAQRLSDQPHVIGYDTMNEPLPGYIGWKDLRRPGGTLLLGACPSPYQAMLSGVGQAQRVGVWKLGLTGIQRTGVSVMNANGRRAWRQGFDCIWRQNGVWEFDSTGHPSLLQPDYFCYTNGRLINFQQDCYRPFANRFAQVVHHAHPEALIFLEAEAGHPPPSWSSEDAGPIVYAPHWYDGVVLMKKTYSPFLAADAYRRKVIFGRRAIERSFKDQLGQLKRWSEEHLNGVPVLLGEFGIPFDMDGKRSYRSGNYSRQVAALDRSFRAIEANLLDCTLWNYTPDNTNSQGDGWNGEDFSIFSRDQQTNPADIDSGGRALEAAVRPYACAVAGEPVKMSFHLNSRSFELSFHSHKSAANSTTIFVPRLQYPSGYDVTVSDGTYLKDNGQQLLHYQHSSSQKEHWVQIQPIPEVGKKAAKS